MKIIYYISIPFLLMLTLAYANATIQDIVGSTLRCKVNETYIITTQLDTKSFQVEKGKIKSDMFYFNITRSNNNKNIFMFDKLLTNTLTLISNKDGLVVFESNQNTQFYTANNLIQYNLDTQDLISISSRFSRKSLSVTLVKTFMHCS